MPDLRPPRTTVALVRDREGRYFGVRPHGEQTLEVVSGATAAFRIRIVDVDGRPVPVRGLAATFAVWVDGALWDTWTAVPDTSLRNVLRVQMTPAQTTALPAGRHRWTVEIADPEDGPVRLLHAHRGGASGEIVVLRDPAVPQIESWRFDSFTPLSDDFDPLQLRWYTSIVPGPATLARPAGVFTVAFRFEAFTGWVGIDVDVVSLTADSTAHEWVTVGPRFDGEPLELTGFTGTEAWSVEADARWIRLWWKPSTVPPDPGRVTVVWVAV